MSILEKMNLAGKTALVTGGARGIGKTAALALAEAGAGLVIADVNLAEAEETAAEITRAAGRPAIAVQTDVTDPLSVQQMVEQAAAKMGPIHIAFLNAGIAANEPAESMAFETWKKVIDVNLTGVFLTAQAIGAQMIKEKIAGSIIATASMSGHVVNLPQPQCAYNASKAGVIMLVKSLAVEWAQHKIRVNSISPGYIATAMTLQSTHWIPEWESRTPFRRMGLPEELQGIVVYLASEAAAYTTGADFVIDGAYTAV